ncbi:hypothetical protein [Streptomyces olivaceoviridis]|uniref:hypothetical protein n=1 Tax=Streptomyces olivaceoviridis TaxID=1921 RepID=UPI0036CEABB5
MTDITDHPTPRAAALALTTTAALDEAARNAPAADSPLRANWQLYDRLTAVLETWHAGGTLREDSLRLTEHLAVELCACLFQRFDRDLDRFGRWLVDFGDQVARTQQHAHPAGPTAIDILSVVADDLTPRPDGTAGTERERLTRLAVPYLGYLRPDHEADDARAIALTLTLWAGPATGRTTRPRLPAHPRLHRCPELIGNDTPPTRGEAGAIAVEAERLS